LANGAIERLVSDMIELRAIVQAIGDHREFAACELVEKLGDLVTVRDASEVGVLARHTDSGVQHHGHQKARPDAQ
jgi:hypothetical protein